MSSETPASTSPTGSTTQPSRALWLVMASICSVQLGSASAKTIFGMVPPTAAAWLRLTSAAVVMLVATALVRGRRRARARKALSDGRSSTGSSIAPRRNWVDGLGYAIVLVAMNWSFYLAISRIPVGIAVTIEFLGPLSIAVWGARRLRDLLWPALALSGVALLGVTPTRLDPTGVLFALVAAGCWAGYITFSARAGRTWPGLEALTLGCSVGAVALAVPAITQAGSALLDAKVLLVGGAVGVLSSCLPYSLEMQALRTMPPRLFGILMSMEPAVAAVFAWLLLREGLHLTDLVAMACVITASVGATRTSRA